MTVQELLTQSLYEIGVASAVQGPNAQDLALCLTRANLIMDGWNCQPEMLYYVSELSFTTTAGKINYAFPTDTNLPVPMKIDRVLIARNSGPTAGFRIDLTQKSWNGEASIFSAPVGFPTGYSYFRPNTAENPAGGSMQLQVCPDDAYGVLMNYWPAFPQFSSLNDVVKLPTGYAKCLCLQTAIEVSGAFEVDPARLTVTTANWQNIMASLKGTQPDGPRNPSEKSQ